MPTFTDDFNRADGSLGANWATPSNASALAIVSNAVKGAATTPTWGAARVDSSVGTFAADQKATVTFTAISNFDWAGPCVRMSSAGDYYGLLYYPTSGTSELILSRWSGGTRTQLTTQVNTLVVGDTLTLIAQGSLLTVQKNGVTAYTFTDTTLTDGNPGIGYTWQNVNGTAVDSFVGTDVLTSATPALGRYRIAWPRR